MRSRGKIEVSTASDCGAMSAPPIPCSTRQAMSWFASADRPQSADAAVNTTSPAAKRLRGPKRSPRRPAVMSKTAYARRYPLNTQRTESRDV